MTQTTLFSLEININLNTKLNSLNQKENKNDNVLFFDEDIDRINQAYGFLKEEGLGDFFSVKCMKF